MTKVTIIKKDGRKDTYNQEKISNAISKAVEGSRENVDVQGISLALTTTLRVALNLDSTTEEEVEVKVEQIEKLILVALNDLGHTKTAQAYMEYSQERTKIREAKSELMNTVKKIGVITDRDNANVGNNFSAKLLRIASESNKQYNILSMPKEMAKLHENLDMYYHDLDSFNLTSNCLHISTGEALRNSFNTGYGTLNVPKRIESAAELSCILLQSTQNDLFGGQSHVDFDNDMAYFVAETRKEIVEGERKRLAIYKSKEPVNEKLVEETLRSRVRQSMQIVCFNLNSMHARAGSQVPFSSINIGLPDSDDAALVCELLLEEYAKGMGKGEQMIFPNIIFRVKSGLNRNPGDPYYYLFKLATEVAARRLNPTFMNMDSSFNLKYYEQGIKPATMGCRTYVCSNVNGQEGPAKRGNNAPTTINLPRIGILANKDTSKFFELLDTKLIEARDSLLYRHEVLKKLKVRDLPFTVGQNMMLGSEGLQEEDSIEPVLIHGTYGIGFTGLAETLTALIGSHHGETEEARELGVKIITHIREFTDKTTQEYSLNFSCYATPAEGLSGKFVPSDRKRYGVIPGVTDKDYYTNGFHVPVGYAVSMIDKIQIEAPYHALCNAGHISYIEVDGQPTGEQIEKILLYAYTNSDISYIGINFHVRYCTECGEHLTDESQKACPKCGSRKIQGVSRVTGYLSLDQRFGPGKNAERKDRVSHDGKFVNTYSSCYND